MFLKITNIGTVSRKYYELIGATNKRERWDDSSVIGNKGSGAKLAVIPSLRLGYDVAVSSTDSDGAYILQYQTKEADLGNRTAQQIIFDYVGNGSFPSQLTLEAFQDWDLPVGDDRMKIFKAFREYMVNAWDEDKDFVLEEVDEIHQSEPGKTSAFITITDEIREILENLPRYFKFLGDADVIHQAEKSLSFAGGSIYPKSQDGVTRLFSQGVLVDCKNSSCNSSLFDYSLNGKSLVSEERIIKDFSNFQIEIGNLLMTINDPKLIIKLFKGMAIRDEARLELYAIEHAKNPSSETALAYRIAWKMHYGEKAILSVENTQIDEDAQNKGFDVVRGLPYSFKEFLQRCGVTNAKDVAPQQVGSKKEEPRFELLSPNKTQQEYFDKAYSLYLKYFPEASKFPVYFFKPLHRSLKDSGGHSGDGIQQHKEIWIAEKSLSSVRGILTILAHEGRHCIKKAGDYDRVFTQAADETIVDFILDEHKSANKNVWQAVVQPSKGILIPKRYAGKKAHVLVHGNEFRIKIGHNTLRAVLPGNISGQISQERKCGIFKTFATVFIPQKIAKQLPDNLALEIC